MPLYRAFLQTLGATLLLAMAVACRSSHNANAASNTTATITGTVTYTRVPLATTDSGVPTGLVDATVTANLKVLPARGVTVRAYQQVDQTQPDGSPKSVWTLAKVTLTDVNGNYSVTVSKNLPTMVEVLSSFDGGRSSLVNVIGDPSGLDSTTEIATRWRYALRKAADGSATGVNPAKPNAPKSTLTANATVNFSVGLNDPWWLVNPTFTEYGANLKALAPFVEDAILETTIPGRTDGLGSGSRVLGIGDSIASFVATYGLATAGSTLDLHYWPGRSEPHGSFIEYNRSAFTPLSFDTLSNVDHYFGSLRGDATNDDAWDEGVILPMLARNVLYYYSNLMLGGHSNRTFSVPSNLLYPTGTPLTHLSPDLARIEGLADAMAANVLKSPYLADTAGMTLAAPVRDLRDISQLTPEEKSPFSAPALRGFAWEIILKANSLPSPGTPTNWATINPFAAVRLFMPPSGLTDSNGSSRDLEPLNIYTQIGRIKEARSGTDTVDLNAVLTDPIITSLAAPFGITWPRPLTGPNASFASFWGADPTSPFPPVVLSMAKAVQVNMPVVNSPGVVSYQLAYPNLTQDEVFYSGFSLTADKRCVLTATISPALAAGSSIDIDLPAISRTFTFKGTGGFSDALVLPGTSNTATFHPVRLRLKSGATIQPDVSVVLALTPAP